MIPEDNVADNETSVEVDRKSNKETSYTTHTDSLNKWVMSEVY